VSNNAAEQEIRPIAMGRKNWTFAGSDEGGRRTAVILHPDPDCQAQRRRPQAWLARLPDHPARRIEELLPWQWCGSRRLAA
jgi:transposase